MSEQPLDTDSSGGSVNSNDNNGDAGAQLTMPLIECALSPTCLSVCPLSHFSLHIIPVLND